MMSAVEILQRYWGYDTFRSPQDEIINDVLKKHDVVALLPTGSGKSLCFQIPTLMSASGVCIVVSPLIALMKDQVASLERIGIKAVALTGTIPQNDLIRIFDNLQFGGVRFLYISPERLQSSFIQEKIKQLPVSLIAIDEAHCISEWGHDFRPSYLNLHLLRELHPHTNLIALTATATKRVVNDISKYLQLQDERVYQKSLIRTNLHLQVFESEDKLGSLLQLIQPIKEPIIVYAGTRKNCEYTSYFLKNKGIKAVFYHAGLSKEAKDIAFDDWYKEKAQVMVSTNAFGMGIDKANVRMVVHTSLPYSIENYVQEAGRAGRDNKKAFSVIIEEITDIKEKYKYYTNSLPTVDFIKKLYQHLNQYFRITYGATPKQTLPFQLTEFCQQYKLPIVKVYNGLEFLVREGIINMTAVSKSTSKLVFTAKNEQLFSYYQRNPKKETILKTILRTYEGIIDTLHVISLQSLSTKLVMSVSELEKQFFEIDRDGIISYHAGNNDAQIQFLKPREDDYTINTIIPNLKQQQKIKEAKYNSILAYLINKETCRNRVIRNYFGEKIGSDCGICDICEGKNRRKSTDNKSIRNTILTSLKTAPLSSKEMVNKLGENNEEVINAIRFLLDTNAIVLTSHNKYKLNEF